MHDDSTNLPPYLQNLLDTYVIKWDDLTETEQANVMALYEHYQRQKGVFAILPDLTEGIEMDKRAGDLHRAIGEIVRRVWPTGKGGA